MSIFEFDLEKVNLEIARKLKKLKAIENKCLPIMIKEDKVIVVTSNETLDNKEEVEFLFNKRTKIIKLSEDFVNELIKNIFLGELEELFDILLLKAIELNASDIHFEPRKEDVFIRFRVDGVLIGFTKIKSEEYQKLLSKIKVCGNMDITEKRRPQDGKSLIKVNGKNYDLRLSTIPIIYGEKLVIRILYGEIFNYNISSLNLNVNQMKKLKKIIALKNGLVIINGPTGSGKSSSLYCILKEINKKDINITTLEDPVEVIIKGVNQVSLNRKANITFATGLRSILRQDPDVLMIGEIRDEETANMAVTASLTGHKVYSTIHTKTPQEVYFRLEDMGVKQYLIKDSLIGIVSQRLIRVFCDNCKKEDIKFIFKGNEMINYKGVGCSNCNYTGYKGRKVVSSVVFIDKEIKKQISNIFQEIGGLNNEEMIDSLNDLLTNGQISIMDYNNFLIEEGLNYEENKINI
ncbi:GspE/PulE family protein [Clostridium tertium]|uniref:GspE/PulE family protein n=1 Tax=Clostridium tertium TaxID=1559 RepID=UPI000DCFF276|nr:GspE/PulE family protein [Clostridium tertium]